MKDKITRLRFKKEGTKSFGNFRIETNPDDDNQELDISIHDLNISKDDVSRNKLIIQKKFSIKVNKSVERELIIASRDIILRNKSDGYEAIYQFSVKFSELVTRDNILIIYHVKAEADGSKAEIGILEFFAETEDNFSNVRLDRPGVDSTPDKVFWKSIRNHLLDFKEYENFINKILCKDEPLDNKHFNRQNAKFRSPFIRSDEYNLIKFATEFFMLKRFGLNQNELSGYISEGKLPYYNFVIGKIKDDLKFDDLDADAPATSDCDEREKERLFKPFMIELIWNYWMEQGMLVQTLNVINLRFQNIKGNNYTDRLQRFDADPLRPLSHILWGYIQDEQHRLSIPRRLNEYDHEYGLTLTGRAVPRINPVDSRVKFLEAFHSLLTLCTIYFKESDDTTRIADAFPILNSLKEVHLLLAEGNHNAYGNLTWTARQEMMMQQYILSRSEMREFLGGRVMVPYPETWMDRVDTMRNIQGWGGTGIVHYHELATHGELLLLSIRLGNWSDIKLDSNSAANWAQDLRNPIQRYIHAYRSVTGIDMSVDQIIQLPANYAIQPAYLIQQRLLEERSRTRRA